MRTTRPYGDIWMLTCVRRVCPLIHIGRRRFGFWGTYSGVPILAGYFDPTLEEFENSVLAPVCYHRIHF